MPPRPILHLLGLALLAPATPAAAAPSPVALYGEEAVYDILRDGATVGRHVIRFTEAGGELRVAASSAIAVGVLGIPLYRFRYDSVSRWRDGRLVVLEAMTDDNGRVRRTTARRDGAVLIVDGDEGGGTASADTLPTDHWNARVLGAATVINTITGDLAKVAVTPVAREHRPAGASHIPAVRHAYAGDLTLDSWYDADGRWLGMRFTAGDGSTIEYVCHRCGPSVEVAQDDRE